MPGAGQAARCCARADRRRARLRPAHRQGRGVARRGDQARCWSSPPTAAWSRDVQPLLRFGVRAIAEDGRQAPGGQLGRRRPHGLDYFDGAARREWHGREAARQARSRCSTRARRRPARCRSCSAPGDSRHPAARGGRPRPRGRLQPQEAPATTPDQIGKLVASTLCTVVDDGTIAQLARRDQRRRRGQPAGSDNVLIENGILRRLHARPALSAKHFEHRRRPATAGASASSHMPHAAHDQHLLLAGPARPRGDHQAASSAASTRRASRGGQVNISQRRLRVLADRELPDRGRQAHRAAQGREPDRQRARRPAQGRHARQRLRALATASGPAARTASRCRSASAPRRCKIAAITVGGTQA